MDEKVEIIKASKSRIDRSNSTVIERLRVAAYCRVSTDSEEQLNSYNSQVKHYKNLIESKENWELVGIYADEAMSGTQTKHRKDFQRMINDAISGKIDLILTKSISRFSRNTLDILKYVRLLKDNHVAVQFEKENINTLDVQGEMLLTILGSLAQAESESISENIKLGFKAKMNRKELIGFSGCLGLDYDPEEKTITINEKEAEIVRYIFKRYVEGAGCYVIARELTQLGYKTKKGNTTWNEGSVRGIVKNEKYVGDVLMQKTFTVDPISKRRLTNFHQLDQYYWKNNHEAIISREVFDKAQEIMNKRSSKHSKTGRGQKYSRKYAFSSMIRCNFCNSNFSRRTWHANSKNEKIMWSCTTGIKKGRKNCPESKHISENDLEEAFVDAFNILCTQNKDITEEFLKNVESTLNTTSIRNDLKKIENEQRKIEGQIERLIDMRLEENLNIEIYEKKYAELSEKHEKIKEKKDELQVLLNEEDDLSNRIDKFRKLFENNQILESFDREIFESVIEKIIVGEIDEEGNINPYSVTFVFSTGLKINKDFSKDNKETEGESNMYPHSSYDTARLGKYARLILGEEPEFTEITLRGSFAHTGKGHGTDLALLAGLMGASPDDLRIPTADKLAQQRGLKYKFAFAEEYQYHPNEAEITLEGKGQNLRIVGTSVGGGRIRIRELDAYKIDLGGEYPTLLASYQDQPGMVAKISAILAAEKINIAQMNVAREKRGGGALLVAEMDSTLADEVVARLGAEIKWVRTIPALED